MTTPNKPWPRNFWSTSTGFRLSGLPSFDNRIGTALIKAISDLKSTTV
jgi:hypothetical protein